MVILKANVFEAEFGFKSMTYEIVVDQRSIIFYAKKEKPIFIKVSSYILEALILNHSQFC